jgi:hypothetical protein
VPAPASVEPARSDSNARHGRDRRDDRRGKGGGGKGNVGGKPVIGMGDHVPAFIMREVRPPKDSDSAEPDNGASDPSAETAA